MVFSGILIRICEISHMWRSFIFNLSLFFIYSFFFIYLICLYSLISSALFCCPLHKSQFRLSPSLLWLTHFVFWFLMVELWISHCSCCLVGWGVLLLGHPLDWCGVSWEQELLPWCCSLWWHFPQWPGINALWPPKRNSQRDSHNPGPQN